MLQGQRIVAVIQARMGSTRLPGKTLRDLCGRPLLYHVVQRLKPSRFLDEIRVATTVENTDDPVIEFCQREGIPWTRGSRDHVLERFWIAAREARAQVLVRITADDPFKDYRLVDQAVEVLLSAKLDFVYNNKPPSFPEGLDVEVFTFQALESAYKRSQDSFEHEHMTQFFFRHPEVFSSRGLVREGENLSHLRWTIDREDDWKMTQMVYEHFQERKSVFLTEDILDFLRQRPDISEINAKVPRSLGYG